MASPPTYRPTNYFSSIQGNLGSLTADDLTYFEQQRRRIRNQYLQGVGQADHQLSALRDEQMLNTRDLTRQFRDARGQIPGSFATGGALNSGLYQKALTDFAQDKNNAFHSLATRFGRQRAGLDLTKSQLLGTYKSALDDVASAEAARRATAKAIRSAQQGF